MVKKHVHPNPQRNIKGGIAEQEAAIQISNVMLVCRSCGPTRVGHKFEGDTKVRVCKKCGQTLAAEEKVVTQRYTGLETHSGTVKEKRQIYGRK